MIKEEKFKIIQFIREFIIRVDKELDNFPKKDIEIKDGYCKVLNLQNIDEHDKTVIEVFKNGMEMISGEYSKNLKIIYEEK